MRYQDQPSATEQILWFLGGRVFSPSFPAGFPAFYLHNPSVKTGPAITFKEFSPIPSAVTVDLTITRDELTDFFRQLARTHFLANRSHAAEDFLKGNRPISLQNFRLMLQRSDTSHCPVWERAETLMLAAAGVQTGLLATFNEAGHSEWEVGNTPAALSADKISSEVICAVAPILAII